MSIVFKIAFLIIVFESFRNNNIPIPRKLSSLNLLLLFFSLSYYPTKVYTNKIFKNHRSFILYYFDSCVPYIKPREPMAFWTAHISFLSPPYAQKRYHRYPIIFKLLAAFWAFQFASHNCKLPSIFSFPSMLYFKLY